MDDPGAIGVAAFLLADHAEAVNGKLYVIGGAFNRLYAGGAPPVVHPHLSVATVLTIPWPATGMSHNVSLTLEDADGQLLLPMGALEAAFEVSRPVGMKDGDESLVPFVFDINGLELGRFGDYLFRLHVDGRPLGEARFRLEFADRN
jgi:hypothetical protein